MNVSQAAANFAVWIRAIVLTRDALLVVDPKRNKLAIAQEKLKLAEKILIDKKEALSLILNIVTQLLEEYKNAKSEKKALQERVKVCKIYLSRAEKLIKGLEIENDSWKKKIINFEEENRNLLGKKIYLKIKKFKSNNMNN